MKQNPKLILAGCTALLLSVVVACDEAKSTNAFDGKACSEYNANFSKVTNCTTDSDGDGLCDTDEKNVYGTPTDKKDVLVEMDYMVDASEDGMKIREKSLQMIKDAYAAQGMNVHIDVGDAIDGGSKVNSAKFNYCGGNKVPLMTDISLDGEVDGGVCNSGDCVSVSSLKAEHFDSNRANAFHYAVLGKRSTSGDGVAGLAWTPGKDLYLTMGSLTGQPKTHLEGSLAITLMHELGHNLNLGHNGDPTSDSNANPTYESIMNYTMGFGMNELGTGLQWRNYMVGFSRCDETNGPQPSWVGNDDIDYVIDYSSGKNKAIDESAVDESAGYDSKGTNVDFDCNGASNDNLGSYDLTTDDSGAITTISDYNDWGNLYFDSILPEQAKPGEDIVKVANICYKRTAIPQVIAKYGTVPERKIVSIKKKIT